MDNTQFDNTIDQELEAMRQQITELKNKVDSQGRLNEDLIKKAIQGKMKGLHKMSLIIAIFALLSIPLYIWMKFDLGLSWPLTIASILLLMGSVAGEYWANQIDVMHMGDDMVETARRLIQMKNKRSLAQKVGVAICIPWIIWFAYECYTSSVLVSQGASMGMIIGLCVGGIIGGTIGIIIYNKMQRTNDEMIDQINDLTR